MEKKINIPELLAPAGNMEKLKTAFHFGADAVYLGLKDFSLRNFAGNFTLEALEDALKVSRALNRKIYVTLNQLPFDEDIERMTDTLKKLELIQPDGIIAADPGVVMAIKQHAPSLNIHISTQTNVMNSNTAAFWFDNGVKRIVVSRELSMEKLKEMTARTTGEIEAFGHGALCISYSGRCFLSLYMTGRDANKGECTQSCRWKYKVLEESERPGKYYPIEEDEQGSYVFNSKDLCSIPILEQLVDTGISSLKIEGRMKSIHYVGVTVDVYRTALDLIKSGKRDEFISRKAQLIEELSRVSNRGFTTNFFEKDPENSEYNMESSDYINHYALVGMVNENHSDYIEIKLKNPLREGDVIQLRDKGFSVEEITVKDIFSSDGVKMDFGRPNSTIRLNGQFKAGKHAIVRK